MITPIIIIYFPGAKFRREWPQYAIPIAGFLMHIAALMESKLATQMPQDLT